MLLIGVDDSGGRLGREQERSGNWGRLRLHFNNLIRLHIGMGLARHLQVEVQALRDKDILAVGCQPAREPAFIRNGEEEEYYRRVGPSSPKFPVNRILNDLLGRSDR